MQTSRSSRKNTASKSRKIHVLTKRKGLKKQHDYVKVSEEQFGDFKFAEKAYKNL